MTIQELENNEWIQTRRIKLANKDKMKKNLKEVLIALSETIDNFKDYDIFKVTEFCEMTINCLSISTLWEIRTKNEKLL